LEKIIKEENNSNENQVQSDNFSNEEKAVASLKKTQIDSYDELESYKNLRKKRVKKAIVRMVVWLLFILFIPVFVFFSVILINPKSVHTFFGYSIYMVTSHSMVGVFNKGDCIIIKEVKSVDNIKIGSDITFIRRSDGETVTHRVIDKIEKENGEIEYITKGVNNPTADIESVSYGDVLGIRIKTSAGLGNLIEFFRTPYGIITFLGIFVLIITGINIAFKMSDDIRAVGVK